MSISMDFTATRVPQDVVSVLGLALGKTFSCQNVSTLSSLFLREASNAPEVTALGFRIESGGDFRIKYSGDPIYLWTDDADGCAVIVTEAA